MRRRPEPPRPGPVRPRPATCRPAGRSAGYVPIDAWETSLVTRTSTGHPGALRRRAPGSGFLAGGVTEEDRIRQRRHGGGGGRVSHRPAYLGPDVAGIAWRGRPGDGGGGERHRDRGGLRDVGPAGP